MNPISISGFKAYDMRGRIPEELNEDVAYRVGRAYAEFVKPRKVIVGRDTRLSSEVLGKALPHPPCRDELGEDDVGQLALQLQPRRDRRPEGDPRPGPPGCPEQRQTRGLETGLPGIDRLATSQLGCFGGTGQEQPPPLTRRWQVLLGRRLGWRPWSCL